MNERDTRASPMLAVIWRGNAVRNATDCARAAASARRAASGEAARRNPRTAAVCRACSLASCQHAHALPAQPGAAERPPGPGASAALAQSRARISPVPSVDPSSSTTTSTSRAAGHTPRAPPPRSRRLVPRRDQDRERGAPSRRPRRRRKIVRFRGTMAATPTTPTSTIRASRLTAHPAWIGHDVAVARRVRTPA